MSRIRERGRNSRNCSANEKSAFTTCSEAATCTSVSSALYAVAKLICGTSSRTARYTSSADGCDRALSRDTYTAARYVVKRQPAVANAARSRWADVLWEAHENAAASNTFVNSRQKLAESDAETAVSVSSNLM